MEQDKREKKNELKQLLKEMLDNNEIEVRIEPAIIKGAYGTSEYYKVQIAIDGRIWYEKVDGWNHKCLLEQHDRYRHRLYHQ